MSLQDVADEIGITEAALYHYIASKNDLLTMVINEAYDTPAADEYNASNATISDCCGHRVCFYPRYLPEHRAIQLAAAADGAAVLHVVW